MKEGDYGFDKKGKEIFNEIKGFLYNFYALMDSQPAANDLDKSEQFLRELNSFYAVYAEISGKSESFYNALTYSVINSIDDETWRKIKNSSTLTDRYVSGKFPKAGAVYNEVKSLGHVFRTVAENYRTLISSYRQEREFELKTKVRQRQS